LYFKILNFGRNRNVRICLFPSAPGSALVNFRTVQFPQGGAVEYVDGDGRLIALLGVKDLIVVDTPPMRC
jgi:hypothetical protein